MGKLGRPAEVKLSRIDGASSAEKVVSSKAEIKAPVHGGRSQPVSHIDRQTGSFDLGQAVGGGVHRAVSTILKSGSARDRTQTGVVGVSRLTRPCDICICNIYHAQGGIINMADSVRPRTHAARSAACNGILSNPIRASSGGAGTLSAGVPWARGRGGHV